MEQGTSFERAADTFLDHFRLIPGQPDLETLYGIMDAFSRIPWENLTKFLVKARGIPRETRLRSPETVISQHIQDGTGGTCFSLTEALMAVLQRAGYSCGPVMADMSHGRNIHCGLLVILKDRGLYLADPGYLVPEPVPLMEGRETRLHLPGQELVWRSCGGGSFDLFTEEGQGSAWRYRLRTGPVDRPEFLLHWQDSFDSTGMNSLHANLRVAEGRIYAHNMNLRRTDAGGKCNEKLRDGYALRMEEYFGIDPRVAEEAEEEWRKACRNR